jgi:hypothetical protein
MSYDIGIYHPTVRSRVEGGEEMDEFDHPKLDTPAVERLVGALTTYGYSAEPSTADCRAFIKHVSGNPIQVHVFATEISFSVPYGTSVKEAIFEAIQDASELVEPKYMCLFDPQTGKWADA